MQRLTFLPIAFLIYLGHMPDVHARYCVPLEVEETEFEVMPRFVRVEAEWYPGWIEYRGDKHLYPQPLEALLKWDDPFMKDHLPSARQQDSYASDISNKLGPVPENPRVQYFQVPEKGAEFSGMCPSFALMDETPW